MKSQIVAVNCAAGLHARPAAGFVKGSKQYQSDVRVKKGDKEGNAKSLVDILSLGVNCGDEIEIICDGADEDTALAGLVKLINMIDE